MWFDSWDATVRVALAGLASYAALVLLLRLSGKRTLSKLNAFDLAVTVAIGSSLSAATLSSDVTVAEGVAGFLVLVLAQLIVARLSVHLRWFGRLVRSEPQFLLRDGVFLDDAMRRERLTKPEVLAAIRQAGQARIEEVGAVVLETDGSISVLPRRQQESTALHGVRDSRN
jgi:uncharacterized membrane protein YcaP (DUF421 family)